MLIYQFDMGNENSSTTREDQSCIFSVENQEKQRRVKLKDASPCNLKMLFGLQSLPKTLEDKQGNCIFHVEGSSWSTKLNKDCSYKVIIPKAIVKEDPIPNQIQTPESINSWDIHCAIVCSQAAQFCGFGDDKSKIGEIENVFRECDLEKHFDVICPSIYGDVRYFLARSIKQEVLYIAFSGTDDFHSMMAISAVVDTEFLKNDDGELGLIKGQCNEYIWNQIKNIPVDLILGKCLDTGIKRVVVCGHGVGGALANVFTLRLQLKLNLLSRKSDPNDNSSLPEVVSITFGAPACLSKDLVQEVGHPDNFFNVINIQDPVPNALERAAGVASQPAYVRKSTVEQIETSYKGILERMTRVFRNEHENQEDCDITQRVEKLNEYCIKEKIAFKDIVRSPFCPIGWYIICCKDEEDDQELDTISVFDIPDVERSAKVEHVDNWHVCYVKNVDLIGKLLAKQKIQESAIPSHFIYTYFKMVCESITRNYRVSVPKEHNELEIAAQSSPQSAVLKNEFPAEARIRLTQRSKYRWRRMFIEEKHLEIVLEGKNLGFFAPCASNFSRLPLVDNKKPRIKLISAERIELVGDFDSEKTVSEQPSVDVATHFEIIRATTDENEIKEVKARTFADTSVDGLSPHLLLRAWQRGITSVVLTESESIETELKGNNLLSQLYKLEKNSSNCGKPLLRDYSEKAATKGFRALGEPDPELLDILMRIAEDLQDDLVIEFSAIGKRFSELFSSFVVLNLPPILYHLTAVGNAIRDVYRAHCKPSGRRIEKLYVRVRKILFNARLSATKPSFFGQIEDNYSAMLCTYISALRDVSDQRMISEDTMASIYELEEALHEKYSALGFNEKNVEEILKENPFKEEHSVAFALEDSKRNILRRIQQSCDLFQLRQYLKEECYIGIVGPQDAGKSTLIKELWGLDVGVIGYTAHTKTANVYQIPHAKKLKVADFPGSTSIDEYMAKVIQQCGGMASFLILVMPYVGDVSRTHLAEYASTADFHLPTLVCINKCAMYFTHSEDFQSKDAVDSARKRYADGLCVNEQDVFFTEILNCSEQMRNKGIADIAEVKKWIEKRLIEFDFYKDDDDELNHALNRPHRCALE